jgi:drug/metabolite transporter (DMT)-like permease
MNSLEKRGSVYAILSGFLYGFIGYFGLGAIHGNLSASTMLFWRFLIASVLIFIIFIPQINTVKRHYRSMLTAFGAGFFGYGISTLLYFYSSLYIGSGLSMVLFFTYPALIILIHYFFYGQVIPRLYYVAVFIIFIGMMLLIDRHQIGFDLRGISLGLASSFFYACYIISSKNNRMPTNLSTLMVCLGCMSTSFIVSYYDNSLALPKSIDTWLNLLGIGVLATVIPIVLMLHSLNYISSERASILSVLEPVFVVIFGVLLLGETLKPWSSLGVVFVLMGAVLTLFSHKIQFNALTQWFYKAKVEDIA